MIDTKKISVRVSSKHLEFLKSMAEANDTKVSSILRMLLNFFIQNDVQIDVKKRH